MWWRKGRSKKRVFTLGLEIYFVFAFSVSAEQCNVTDIEASANSTTSVITYHVTFSDSHCSGREKMKVVLKDCSGSSVDSKSLYNDSGTFTSLFKGTRKLVVDNPGDEGGSVESPCFELLGRRLFDPLLMFEQNMVQFTFPNDSRVSGWTLEIYKGKSSDRHYCKNSALLRQFEKKFQIVRSISKKGHHLTVKDSFNIMDCYCFRLTPKTSLELLPRKLITTTNDCKFNPSIQDPSPVFINQKSKFKLIGLVLVMVLVLVLVAVMVRCARPQRLCQFLRPQRRYDAVENHDMDGKTWLGYRPKLLLLYTPDVSHSVYLTSLKKNLRNAFKVYNIYDHDDPEKMADKNGWLQGKMLPSADVKLLLVESPRMTALIHDLLKPTLVEPPSVTEVKNIQGPDLQPLLLFALRGIIGTQRRQDYSTVFIVRFPNEENDVRKKVKFAVEMRLYNFPEHFQKLKDDMLSANTDRLYV